MKIVIRCRFIKTVSAEIAHHMDQSMAVPYLGPDLLISFVTQHAGQKVFHPGQNGFLRFKHVGQHRQPLVRHLHGADAVFSFFFRGGNRLS